MSRKDEMLTTAQVAELLNVPVDTVRHWRWLGRGPEGVRLGRGVRYRRSGVEAWVAERYVTDRDHRLPKMNPYDEWGADRLMAHVEQYGWPEAVKEVTRRLTKKALAEKKAQGVVLGRPPAVADDTRDWCITMRERGWTFRDIAAALNDENVPTAQGGARWHPSTVQQLVARG